MGKSNSRSLIGQNQSFVLDPYNTIHSSSSSLSLQSRANPSLRPIKVVGCLRQQTGGALISAYLLAFISLTSLSTPWIGKEWDRDEEEHVGEC